MFYHINRVQPTYYIDEMFHIPQTMKYCNGKFFEVYKQFYYFYCFYNYLLLELLMQECLFTVGPQNNDVARYIFDYDNNVGTFWAV